MKTVLLPIHAEWCAEIINGKKTVEVRKTKPKDDEPFNCIGVNFYRFGCEFGKAMDNVTAQISRLCSKLNEFADKMKIENRAIKAYPNKRIVELALHSKKARVRKKNMKKIVEYYCEIKLNE